jgi:TRAP-type C4-dicarboxylate transport system substrate-binding protein
MASLARHLPSPFARVRALAGAGALAGACALAGEASAAPAVWPVATGYSIDSFQTINLQQFAADVSAATRGELVLELHPANSLVKLADIRAQVEADRIPAGEVIMTSLVNEIPIAGADAVPFIVGSYDAARTLWRFQRPGIEAALAQRGLVALYAVPWPPQGLYTTRPIASTLALKGAHMRTYNATTARIAELVGAHAVDVPMTGVAQALADGRIDSMITSGVTGAESKAWDHLKYFYDIRAWFPKNLVIVNKARFDALPEAARAAVLRCAQAAEERGWTASEAASAAALRELAAHGMHVETPGFEIRDELRRYGEKFSLEWVRATGQGASAILIPFYTIGAHTPVVAR